MGSIRPCAAPPQLGEIEDDGVQPGMDIAHNETRTQFREKVSAITTVGRL